VLNVGGNKMGPFHNSFGGAVDEKEYPQPGTSVICSTAGPRRSCDAHPTSCWGTLALGWT